MTGTPGRIRWEDDLGRGTGFTGSVGTCEPWLFQVWRADGGWTLEARLPGAFGKRIPGTDPDKLKAEAEEWLERFVSSLGAIFPDELLELADGWKYIHSARCAREVREVITTALTGQETGE